MSSALLEDRNSFLSNFKLPNRPYTLPQKIIHPKVTHSKPSHRKKGGGPRPSLSLQDRFHGWVTCVHFLLRLDFFFNFVQPTPTWRRATNALCENHSFVSPIPRSLHQGGETKKKFVDDQTLILQSCFSWGARRHFSVLFFQRPFLSCV